MAISSERKSAILKAISELHQATGQVPTVNAVIEKMGGGSASYVTPVLRGWREEQSKREREVRAMPEAVQNAMKDAAAKLWAIATEEADSDLNHFKDESEKEKQQLLQERDLALTDLEAMEAALAKANDELASVTEAAAELKTINAKLEDQVRETQAKLDVKAVEAQSLQTRLNDHIAQLADLKQSSALLETKLLEIAGKASK